MYSTTTLISHAKKVMLKILQARLQQHVKPELPDVQTRFRQGRGTRNQIANICRIKEKAREFQKSIYFCFIDYAKAFDCVDHNKLWEILKEMGIPDYLTCLLRNLYAGQEATVRTAHGTMKWFKTGKGVHQAVYCHPAYLTYKHSAGMHAKSLQSWPTLCHPMDSSLLGFSVHGDSPGKNTGVGCHALLQGIFPAQRLNPGLLHCRQILYQLSY